MRKGLCRGPISVAVWMESLGTGACLQGASSLKAQLGFSSGIFLVASHSMSASEVNNRLLPSASEHSQHQGYASAPCAGLLRGELCTFRTKKLNFSKAFVNEELNLLLTEWWSRPGGFGC